MLLRHRGHEVSGISLAPIKGALYETAGLKALLKSEFICDIRDVQALNGAFEDVNPDVVIHLAAQALVNEGYRDPRTTYQTNTVGTLNVLDAAMSSTSARAQLIVTTDKVYQNSQNYGGHLESDPLGGEDPYSASKAAADILTQSWMSNFSSPLTAIARAGNVIGGGDVCRDRLIPDLIAAYSQKKIPELRYPNAVRPWQHVLDCLNGYLVLVDYLLSGKGNSVWNFGPNFEDARSVSELAERFGVLWGTSPAWKPNSEKFFEESDRLVLDSTKSKSTLGWSNKLTFEQSVDWTFHWYHEVKSGKQTADVCIKQIRAFEGL